MNNDWLYSPDRLALRGSCLSKLLKKYGAPLSEGTTPLYSSESIYACAHDWVSQGHPVADGIEQYFEDNYSGSS